MGMLNFRPVGSCLASKKEREAEHVNLIPFSEKHKEYYLKSLHCRMNVAEGAYRAGKSVMNILSFANYLEDCPDKVHLVSGYSASSARLNVSDANGFGLSYLFRGRCKTSKYEGNECLRIKTRTGEKIVLFVGGGNSDSYKKIQGQSFGSWLSVEVANLYIGNDIDKNFINMALSRLTQSGLYRVWWDLNPTYEEHDVYKKYINEFQKQSDEGTFVGGFNYDQFTLFDNSSLSKEQIEVALGNFGDKDSILYKRGVLGLRGVAQGVIFGQVANKPDNYIVDMSYFKDKKGFISIGVDFGGNSSGHYFTATWISNDYREVVIVANKYVQLSGGDYGIASLSKPFEEFIPYVQSLGVGSIRYVFADSAEQVLIAELRNSLRRIHKASIVVNNSYKNQIKSRIDAKTMLINSGRWHILDSCISADKDNNILESTKRQVWDDRAGHEDERLDNNNSFVNDGADSEEYSWEMYIDNFTSLS